MNSTDPAAYMWPEPCRASLLAQLKATTAKDNDMTAETLRERVRQTLVGHSWMGLRGCQCGWQKPPHSVGHTHHLADLIVAAGFVDGAS